MNAEFTLPDFRRTLAGNFNFSNPMNTNSPQTFYLLQSP
jgi:hypothetical protein